MDTFLKTISNDIENHCKNIDNFNKDMLSALEKSGNDTINTLLSLISIDTNIPSEKQNKKRDTTYNPFSE